MTMPARSMPARSWTGVTDEDSERTDFVVGWTDPGDNCVVLSMGNESVVLDPAPIRELVTELLRRLVLIAGPRVAVEAAADASVAPQASIQPPHGRSWWLTDAGHAALGAAESAAEPCGGVTTPAGTDERSSGAAGRLERLLYITPTRLPAGTSLEDDLVVAMRAAIAAGTPGLRYRGFHRCTCGARSANYDVRLPGGAWTHTLAVHYLAQHRNEIPHDQLEQVAAYLGVAL
jgi:hypothetical protein